MWWLAAAAGFTAACTDSARLQLDVAAECPVSSDIRRTLYGFLALCYLLPPIDFSSACEAVCEARLTAKTHRWRAGRLVWVLPDVEPTIGWLPSFPNGAYQALAKKPSGETAFACVLTWTGSTAASEAVCTAACRMLFSHGIPSIPSCSSPLLQLRCHFFFSKKKKKSTSFFVTASCFLFVRCCPMIPIA